MVSRSVVALMDNEKHTTRWTPTIQRIIRYKGPFITSIVYHSADISVCNFRLYPPRLTLVNYTKTKRLKLECKYLGLWKCFCCYYGTTTFNFNFTEGTATGNMSKFVTSIAVSHHCYNVPVNLQFLLHMALLLLQLPHLPAPSFSAFWLNLTKVQNFNL